MKRQRFGKSDGDARPIENFDVTPNYLLFISVFWVLRFNDVDIFYWLELRERGGIVGLQSTIEEDLNLPVQIWEARRPCLRILTREMYCR